MELTDTTFRYNQTDAVCEGHVLVFNNLECEEIVFVGPIDQFEGGMKPGYFALLHPNDYQKLSEITRRNQN